MATLSDQFMAHFRLTNLQPAAALAQWTETHPGWLPEDYKVIDGSYNSVTWQWLTKQFVMKLLPFSSLFGGQTAYRITAQFESDGGLGTVVTVNGQADDKTRAAIQASAENYLVGGAV
jgi:hypothetical protein